MVVIEEDFQEVVEDLLVEAEDMVEIGEEVLAAQEEIFLQDQDSDQIEVQGLIFQLQDSLMTIKKTSEDKSHFKIYFYYNL